MLEIKLIIFEYFSLKELIDIINNANARLTRNDINAVYNTILSLCLKFFNSFSVDMNSIFLSVQIVPKLDNKKAILLSHLHICEIGCKFLSCIFLYKPFKLFCSILFENTYLVNLYSNLLMK